MLWLIYSSLVVYCLFYTEWSVHLYFLVYRRKYSYVYKVIKIIVINVMKNIYI